MRVPTLRSLFACAYNCYGEPELTSWGTEFYVDAFYHYLRQRYGDIYVDEDSHRVISMISTPKVAFSPDESNVRVNGLRDGDGLGIYAAPPKSIEAIFVDGKPTYYFNDHTARTPSYKGNKRIKILLDEARTSQIIRSNSIVTKTMLSSTDTFNIVIKGMKNTKGILNVYWGASKPIVKLDGTPLTENIDWAWSNSDSIVRINYIHNGNERNITLEPSRGRQGIHS